jgi:hypothetical protein
MILAYVSQPPASPIILQFSRPEVIFVDQPFSWIPTAISVFQFVALLGFAIYTFRFQAQQKIRERQAAWFHKVVVDPLIDRIDDFFSRSLETLHIAAGLVDKDRLSGASAISQQPKHEIAFFKEKMFGLSAEVSRRLGPFDSKVQVWAAGLFDKLEEDVTRWFDSQLLTMPHQRREDLDNILVEFYKTLLRGLIRMEFQRWG